MAQIARAGKDRLLAFHVCDWLVPTRDILNDRGMMGDGVIDIKSLRAAVEAQGYAGYSEIEIFSNDWWAQADGRGVADLHRAAQDGGVMVIRHPEERRLRRVSKDEVTVRAHGSRRRKRLLTMRVKHSSRTARSRNPRNRTRPPRTGSPLERVVAETAPGNREIAIAPSSRASAMPAH